MAVTAAAARSPRNLLTSLILVFPLFAAYQVGVLLTLPMMNGADLLTSFLLRKVGLGPSQYLAFSGLAVLTYLLGVVVLRRTQRFNPVVIVPVLIESALYALSMGSLIYLLMTHVLHIPPKLAAGIEGESLVGRVVMSLGAGVWEETLFRLGLLTVLALVFENVVGLGRFVAIGGALVLSSLAFSAMHHIPPYGDPLRLGLFTFRVLAGMFFGLLYWWRGFAVAVYTHAMYDVWVLVIH